jgi:hypothetical protein
MADSGTILGGFGTPVIIDGAATSYRTGNPTMAGTFNFTIKATDGNLTSALAYQITVTVQGPPDQLQCNTANGGEIAERCDIEPALCGSMSHRVGGFGAAAVPLMEEMVPAT